jgi:hypothetical protein
LTRHRPMFLLKLSKMMVGSNGRCTLGTLAPHAAVAAASHRELMTGADGGKAHNSSKTVPRYANVFCQKLD